MTASDLAIKNPVFAWMLMAGFMVFGAVGFSRMGISQLPDVDFPVVTVTITYLGAAPEVMESAVADPLEDQLTAIEGLKTLTTVSTIGTMTATLEFALNRNVDGAVQDTETAVLAAQKLFPPNVDPATIKKTNPDDQPIVWLALTAEGHTQRDMLSYARDFVKDQFTTIDGVGDVLLGGYIDPAMRVWVDPVKLRKNNIAITDIVSAINQESVEIPGGDFDAKDKNLNLRTFGEGATADDFRNVVINHRAGHFNDESTQIVRLKDIARVEPGTMEVTKLSRFNGLPAVGLGIVKQKGSNAVGVAREVKKRAAELRKTLPAGYKLEVNFDTTRFIEESIHELNSNLIMSALLTALCCWIFLGSLSATFNVVLSIPTSIMGAFIVLYFMGFTLNTFTLLGLSLAIGIVVDDAIMVLENIFRHSEEGLPRLEAAIVGAREITFAALAATIAIVAIFLPVAFMVGIIGKFFFQFGVTISVTVLLSLVEALTITPMRCSRFVTIHKRTDFFGRNFEKGMDKMRSYYALTLKWALDHPWKIVIAATIVMVLSFTTVTLIKKEFSPSQDQSVFLVRVKLPTDASVGYTDSLMRKAELWFKTQPTIKQFYVAVGGAASTASLNQATIFLTMKEKGDRPYDPVLKRRPTQQDYMAIVRKNLLAISPDMQIFVQDLSMRGFTATRGFPIEFTVRGTDWKELWDTTSKLMTDLKDKGLATDIDTDYLLGKPELDIHPDRQAAALHGVTIQDIGTTIAATLGGVRVNQYTEHSHRYWVMLQVDPQYNTPETFQSLLVNNSQNNLTPLKEVVSAGVEPALQSVTRIDRQRAISVYANPAPGHSQQDALKFVEEQGKHFPAGNKLVFNGSAETFRQSFESLIYSLVLGIFVAYMVLATQFNSFIDPISVLVALPFSVSGAFLGLLICHQSLNIYSMIGLILLMGIVKKNSILLVEFANSVRDGGENDVKKALLTACPVRLRPIVMTSFACITAAIPEALNFGTGSETTIPMAVAIIGGVSVSTFLTLYVVPCVYELFSRIQSRQEDAEEIRTAFKNVGTAGHPQH